MPNLFNVDLTRIPKGHLGCCVTEQGDGIYIRQVSCFHFHGAVGRLDPGETYRDIAILKIASAEQARALAQQLGVLAEKLEYGGSK